MKKSIIGLTFLSFIAILGLLVFGLVAPASTKADTLKRVVKFETQDGGTIASDAYTFTSSTKSLTVEMGIAEDIDFPEGLEIGFGIGDSEAVIGQNYPYVSENAIFCSRQAVSADTAYNVFSGGKFVGTGTDRDASKVENRTIARADVFHKGYKVKFNFNIFANNVQYELYIDRGTGSYERINGNRVYDNVWNCSSISTFSVYFQVNKTISISMTDLKAYATDNGVVTNLDFDNISSNVKTFNADQDLSAIESDVYLWDTKGGSHLYSDAVAKVDGKVKLTAELSVYEDMAIASEILGFSITDASTKTNNYPYTTANTIWFALNGSIYQVFNGGSVKKSETANISSANLFKAGNRIKCEITYEDGVGTVYNLYLYNGITSNYELKDSIEIPQSMVNLDALTEYHMSLGTNAKISLKTFDFTMKGNDANIAFDGYCSNHGGYQVIDVNVEKPVVTFKNGDTIVKTIEVDPETSIQNATIPVAPDMEGKVFQYWTLNGEQFSFSTPITEDIELVAKYRENTGKCGIVSVYNHAYDGTIGLAITFDTYIKDVNTAAKPTTANTETKNVLANGHPYNYGGCVYITTQFVYDTTVDREAENPKSFSSNCFQMWVRCEEGNASRDAFQFGDRNKVIITLKEGTPVGNFGEVLDRDYNIVIEKDETVTGANNLGGEFYKHINVYILNNVEKTTYAEDKVEVDFDYYVNSTVAANLRGEITINGIGMEAAGAKLEFVDAYDGTVSKKIRLDLTDVEKKDILVIKFTSSNLNINQALAKLAINTKYFCNSVLAEDYTLYLVKEGEDYVQYLDGEHVYGIVGETTKSEYALGEEFDLTTVSAKELKINGDETEVTLTGATVSGYDKNVLGEQTVTITTAIGATFTLTVTIKDVQNGIQASTNKNTYRYGEELDKNTITVNAVMSQGTIGDTIAEFEVSGYEKNVLGTQTITITAGEYTATITLSVENYVESYTGVLNKEHVYYNEELAPTDFTIKEVMADGSAGEEVTATNVVNYSKNTLGTQKVVVVYAEGQLEVSVNVEDKITGITVTTTITDIANGEALDLSKINVTYVMLSGATGETVRLTEENIEGYDAQATGIQTVTVKVGDYSSTFGVNVLAPAKKGCKNSAAVGMLAMLLSIGGIAIVGVCKKH